MANPEKIKPSKQKSFLIKDILNFADEIPKGNGKRFVDLPIQRPFGNELKERISDWDIMKKGECFANNKSKNVTRATGRSPFSDAQREILEKRFQKSKYITLTERRMIADEIHLTERQVKTWYQNRRTRWRKAHGNQDLSKGTSLGKDNINAGEILSNFSDKLSLECVVQLHKQLTKT